MAIPPATTGARLGARSSADSSKMRTPITALLRSAETERWLVTKCATTVTPTVMMDAVVTVLLVSLDGTVANHLVGFLFAQRSVETVS